MSRALRGSLELWDKCLEVFARTVAETVGDTSLWHVFLLTQHKLRFVAEHDPCFQINCYLCLIFSSIIAPFSSIVEVCAKWTSFAVKSENFKTTSMPGHWSVSEKRQQFSNLERFKIFVLLFYTIWQHSKRDQPLKVFELKYQCCGSIFVRFGFAIAIIQKRR